MYQVSIKFKYKSTSASTMVDAGCTLVNYHAIEISSSQPKTRFYTNQCVHFLWAIFNSHWDLFVVLYFTLTVLLSKPALHNLMSAGELSEFTIKKVGG